MMSARCKILSLLLLTVFFGSSSGGQEGFFPPTKIFGDGDVLVTFEVKVPRWTPKEDKVYIQIEGYQPQDEEGNLLGAVPMEEKESNLWTVIFKAPQNKVTKYRYTRNNWSFSTAEEFTPDSDRTRRKVKVFFDPILVRDRVKKWRWLSKKAPKAKIPGFKPSQLPEREEPFAMGASTWDFFDLKLADFISATFDRIQGKGFEYVGIAYAPSYFVGGKPLKFSREPLNTYTVKQLISAIDEAHKRGLKVALFPGIENDPGNSDIDAEFGKKQSDNWYRKLAEEWEQVMVKTAKFAEKYQVEIFAPSDQWFVWGVKTDTQKIMLNRLINHAYKKIRRVYSGKISSDSYDEDPFFDYYKQMDWIGSKWTEGIADKKKTRLNEMKTEAERIIDESYKPIYEKYGKPIFLAQLVYCSYDGAAGALPLSWEDKKIAEWLPYNPKYPADFKEQVDAHEAVFQAIYDEPMFAGAFTFSYTYWNSYDKGPGIRSKPAEDVWVKWIDIFSEN